MMQHAEARLIDPPRTAAAPGAGKRLAAASMVGTALEWYDFMIYNTMAALIFNQVFFPSVDPMVGTLLAFSTYAVGYLSRPLGGVVFGRLGDKLGRRAVLVLTLSLMGVTTAAMAVLPGYATIGIWSPVLLVALRFVQGVALGGEWAGAVLLTVEHGRADRRGLNASWAQVGPAAGTLLSSAVIAAVTAALAEPEFLSWGWRVPFALSALLVLFGLWIRTTIDETPLFREMQARQETAKAPVGEVLRDHWRALLIAGAARIGPDVIYSLLVVFSVTYVTQVLHLPRSLALTALLCGAALNVVATPLFGALTDKVGRRPVYAGGLVASLVWGGLFFVLVDSRDTALIIVAVGVGMIFHAAMYAAQGSFITEQFAPRVRYTGSSIAYTFGSLAGGGAFAPLIMATVLQETAGTAGISIYVVVALLATGIGLACARETARG
ncbi:MFS transporter [Inquilinus sp.]|jgi:MFS family permease|uniref:MFS transporter n=1 Tax=Inquilinus sp. TaxID=1932117 RepID=UPI0037830843